MELRSLASLIKLEGTGNDGNVLVHMQARYDIYIYIIYNMNMISYNSYIYIYRYDMI